MEVNVEYDFIYWKAIPRDTGLVDCSKLQFPTGTQGEKLKAMRAFKAFEKQIAEEGFKGWVATTLPTNYKMLKLFDSLGAEEFYFGPVEENGKIWNEVFFYKECRRN